MAAKDRNSGANQGRIAMVVCSTDNFDTRARTKSTMPRGG